MAWCSVEDTKAISEDSAVVVTRAYSPSRHEIVPLTSEEMHKIQIRAATQREFSEGGATDEEDDESEATPQLPAAPDDESKGRCLSPGRPIYSGFEEMVSPEKETLKLAP